MRFAQRATPVYYTSAELTQVRHELTKTEVKSFRLVQANAGSTLHFEINIEPFRNSYAELMEQASLRLGGSGNAA